MIRKISALVLIAGMIMVGYYSWEYYAANASVTSIPELEEEDREEKQKSDNTAQAKSAKEDEQIPVEQKQSLDAFWTEKFHYETGSKVAMLDMPKVNKRFTTYWGTDENTLDRGVGMYVSEWTTVPNNTGGHTVLSGHRDTVFVFLPELKVGDVLQLHYDGETFEYEIRDIWITDKEDRSVIVKKEKPTLTLTTCYPFEALGNTDERYIIQSELINSYE